MISITSERHHYKQAGRYMRCLLLYGLLPAITALVIAGCAAVGPDYARVEPDAPQEWHTQLRGGLTADLPKPETLAQWWRALNDAELSSLEERAVKGNLDLKKALSRIHEARALRGISKAGLFPTLDASASATNFRSSESSSSFEENKFYSAGFDAGWELDVFGGVRRSVEAAQATLEATQEDLYDVLVSLLAEVALNYVEVRTFQTALTVTETNIKSQEETYELNRSRYQAGIINELAVQQSLYNLERTRSTHSSPPGKGGCRSSGRGHAPPARYPSGRT